MTDEEQQAKQHLMLDALCHAYEHLLEHVDAFDEAVGFHPDWDGYRLVSQCVNPAVARFGRSPIDTKSVSTLCADLLRRLKGFLDGELPGDSPVFPVFETYQGAVLGSPPPSPADLVQYQEIGERLSKDCYLKVCASDSPNLARLAELIIKPRNRQRFKSRPDKRDGVSAIVFEFAAHEFTFDTFVNLPFFFFHEYFSHIHSSEMYAERFSVPAPFEDGWLLYAAHQFYRQNLIAFPCPDYRRFCVGKYIYEATSLDRGVAVRFGYQQAESFEELAGSELFWQLTLKLASVHYYHLPGCPDLHHEFLIRLKDWLRRVTIISSDERNEALGLLDLALQDEAEPVRSLLDLLI
jgi:hypothetical protein